MLPASNQTGTENGKQYDELRVHYKIRLMKSIRTDRGQSINQALEFLDLLVCGMWVNTPTKCISWWEMWCDHFWFRLDRQRGSTYFVVASVAQAKVRYDTSTQCATA